MRALSPTLQAAMDSDATTLTRLLRVNLKNGTTYGLCMTNKTVAYDHGDGEITYLATDGFDPSRLASDISHSVNNAEAHALVSEDIEGITTEMITAGVFKSATWAMYYVDYENLVPGSACVLDVGDVGDVKLLGDDSFTLELLSYTQRLSQPLGDSWSKHCRADFGTPANSPRGCGVDAEALWVGFTVESVGAEELTTFTVEQDSSLSGNYYPGRLEFTTGKNAGFHGSVRSYDNGQVMLMEELGYPVEVGDEGRIRPDCAKTVEACKAYDNYLNMKAEPLIPDSDDTVNVPKEILAS